MHTSLILTLVPLISLLCDIAIQQTVFRIRGRRDPWGSILIGFLGGFVVAIAGSVLVIGTLQTGDSFALILMNIVSFVALAHGYFNFVNLHLTSLRVRILRELVRADGPVTSEELLRLYDAREALALRLNRLIEKQQLRENNGRYYVDGRTSFLVLVGILDFLRWLVLGHSHLPRIITR